MSKLSAEEELARISAQRQAQREAKQKEGASDD